MAGAVFLALVGTAVGMAVGAGGSTSAPAPSASATSKRPVTPTRSASSSPKVSTPTRAASTATQASAPPTNRFTLTPPAGWGYATTSGKTNDVRLVNAQGSTLTVYSWTSQETGAARCTKELNALKVWAPGRISPVPDMTVAGEPLQGGQLEGDRLHVLRCAQKNGRVYNLSSDARFEDADAVAAAYEQVVASWQWT